MKKKNLLITGAALFVVCFRITVSTGEEYIFSYSDNTVSSNRKTLKKNPFHEHGYKISSLLSNKEKCICSLISSFPHNKEEFNNCKIFSSFPEVFPAYVEFLPSKAPTAYMEWLKENNYLATKNSYKEFRIVKNLENYSEAFLNMVEYLRKTSLFADRDLEELLLSDTEQITTFYGMITNSFHNGSSYSEIEKKIMEFFKDFSKYRNQLDKTKTVEENFNNCYASWLLDEHSEVCEILEISQKLFKKSLERKSDKNFEVYIPVTIQEIVKLYSDLAPKKEFDYSYVLLKAKLIYTIKENSCPHKVYLFDLHLYNDGSFWNQNLTQKSIEEYVDYIKCSDAVESFAKEEIIPKVKELAPKVEELL